MAAPTVRGVSAATGSGTTSMTVAHPASTAENDLLVMLVESSDSTTAAGTPSTPSGWNSIFEQTYGAGATGVTTLTIFARLAPASVSDVTVDGVLNHCEGRMIGITAGTHGVADVTTDIVMGANNQTVGTTDQTTTGITVTADSLILWCFGITDNANDLTNINAYTNANLASITKQFDEAQGTSGAGGGVALVTGTCAGTTTGDGTFTHDNAVQCQSVHLGVPPLSGTTTLTARAHKWYLDGAETTSVPLANENMVVTVSDVNDENLNLRYGIQESTGLAGATTDDYQLQYSLNGGTWTDVTGASSVVKGYTSGNLTDAAATTQRLSAGSGSFVAGEISETDGLLTDFQITANNYTELLYAVTTVAADIVRGSTIAFRVLRNTVALSAYTFNPTLKVGTRVAVAFENPNDQWPTPEHDPANELTAPTVAQTLTNTLIGTHGTTLTSGSGGNTASGGNFLSAISGTGAGDQIAFSTAKFHSGTSSALLVSTATGNEYMEWTTPEWTADTQTSYFRTYINIASNAATNDNKFIRVRDSGGTLIAALDLGVSRHIRIEDSTGSQVDSPAHIPFDQWIRAEIQVPIGNSVSIVARLFYGANLDGTTPSVEWTFAGADTDAGLSNIGTVQFGNSIAGPIIYFDDIGASSNTWLGPVTGSNQHVPSEVRVDEFPTPENDPAGELETQLVFSPTARAYRWYADGTETGASALANENTSYQISDTVDATLVLRYGLQESGGLAGFSTDDYQLQYKLNGGSFTDVTAASSVIKGFTSTNLTDAAVTTQRLSAGSGSFISGEISETDGLLTDYQITASNHTELLFAVSSVATDIAPNDTITFRVLCNGSVFTSYSVTPTLTTTTVVEQRFENHFEGTNNANLVQGSTGNTSGISGNYFDTVSTGGAAPDGITFDTTAYHSGSSSVEVNSTNSAPDYVAWDASWTNITGTLYVRAYIYIKTRGSGSPSQLIRIYDSDVVTPVAFLRLDGTTGNPAIRSGDSASNTGTPSSDLSLNTWYRVEMEVPIGNSVTITTRIFAGANLDTETPTQTITQTAADTLRTAGNLAEVRFASSVTSTVVNFDDVGLSDTTWLGPYVNRIVQDPNLWPTPEWDPASEMTPPPGSGGTGVPTSLDSGTGYTGTYTDIDEATTFGGANDADYMIQTATGTTAFKVGFSLTPGTISDVTVNTRHVVAGASGLRSYQIKLYDGASLIATGSSKTLALVIANDQDSFSGLSLDASNLHVEVNDTTSVNFIAKTTLLWVDVTYSGGASTNLAARAYRWYADGTETGATALAAENASYLVSSASDENIALRYGIQESGAVAGATTDDYQLQYNLNAGSWTDVTDVSSVVRGYGSANLTDEAATTNRLSAGSGSFVAGEISVTDGLLSDFQITASNHTELLYSVTTVAADINSGDAITFRVLRNTAVLNTYTQTPTLTTAAATFAITAREYRWYEDGTETGATAAGSTNASITVSATVDRTLGLRYGIQETGGANGLTTDDYQLQYALNAGSWTNVTSSSSVVKGYTSTNLTDAAVTTQRLGSGSGSFISGEISETDGLLTDFQLTTNNFSELLYAITTVATDIVDGDTITFRVLRNAGVFDAYSLTPSLSVSAPGAVTLRNTFNGTDGTTFTAGSGGNTGGASGDYFDVLNGSEAREFDTAYYHSAPSSGRFVSTTSGNEYLEWTTQWNNTSNTCYFRFYVRTDGALGGTDQFLQVLDSNGTKIGGVNMSTSGRFQPYDITTFAQSAPGYATSTWHRIELQMPIGNSVSMVCRIFTGANIEGATPDETVTFAGADTLAIAGDIATVRFGNSNAGCIINIDDVGVSDTDWLGPYNPAATQVILIF